MDCDFSPSSPHLLPNGLFSPQNQISFELLALSGLSEFSTFKGGKMLIFQGFANSRIVREFPPFSFKVQIATLTRNQLYLRVPWVRIPPTPPENSVCKRFLPFAGFFFFLHLWDFSVSSLLKIGSSLLNFLRFELWICSWRILSKAIRRRSYEITSNAPLRPFTIASADDSLEL